MSPRKAEPLPIDVAIFGGGVLGLWTLDELRRRGYRALLFETNALGAGQTVCAQGILHGGTKYSLAGVVDSSARAVSRMPERWRECLEGRAEPDVSGTVLLSDCCVLWNTQEVKSRAGMLGAKMALRVRPKKLALEERPPLLAKNPGDVLVLPEQVIHPASLCQSFAHRNAEYLFHYRPFNAGGAGFELCGEGNDCSVNFEVRGRADKVPLSFTARRVIFTAGSGNEILRQAAGFKAEKMQRRPLHMVMMRGDADILPPFYGHCIDGAATRITITAAPDSRGRTVWQLGGQLAEEGTKQNPDELLRKAVDEVRVVLPDLDLGRVEWATYSVDRAERKTATGRRPEGYAILEDGPIITAWPTKLVLAPEVAGQLADRVAATISLDDDEDEEALVGEGRPDDLEWKSRYLGHRRAFEHPPVAMPPWEEDSVRAPNWISTSEVLD